MLPTEAVEVVIEWLIKCEFSAPTGFGFTVPGIGRRWAGNAQWASVGLA